MQQDSGAGKDEPLRCASPETRTQVRQPNYWPNHRGEGGGSGGLPPPPPPPLQYYHPNGWYQYGVVSPTVQSSPPEQSGRFGRGFVVQDVNKMKVARETSRNLEAMTGLHLAAQTIYRLPVTDLGVEKFINLLSNGEELASSWRRSMVSILYTGSFAGGAELNGRFLPRLFEEIPSLRSRKFTSEVCDRIYSIFIDLMAAELSEEARDVIKRIRPGDVAGRFSGGAAASNIVSGSLDLLSRVKLAFEKSEPGSTAIEDVEEGFSNLFERASDSKSSSESRTQALTRISDFAQFFKQLPRQLLSQELIDRVKRIPLYKKTMHIQETERAFLLLSSAANRALIQLSKQTRNPNALYEGISTDFIHFWIASLRYEQNRWLKQAFPNLNNEQLENRAAFDLKTITRFSTPRQPLRDKYLGTKIDPPISYAALQPNDDWSTSDQDPKALKHLPYFHIFKGLSPPTETV